MTLTSYLRSIGLSHFYIDRRKDHFRIKIIGSYTNKQWFKLISLGLKVEIKVRKVYGINKRVGYYRPLVIRVSTNPSKIIL